jgi:hypothetical protein
MRSWAKPHRAVKGEFGYIPTAFGRQSLGGSKPSIDHRISALIARRDSHKALATPDG